ncbi:MAG: leucine-rich repeat domain-containing protein, partial [Clostridia bacterium]|nr:leucine-rich repeat domain-containing protein [Clostridia bacterium]
CTSLTSVTIPANVTSIGDSAFENCEALTSVTIPANVTSIGSYAFYGCTSLTSVTIPAGVTSIGAGAFQGCTSLTSVTIPANVTSIDDSAFYGCTALTTVYYNGTVTGDATDGYTVANFNFGTSIKIIGFTFDAASDSDAYTVTGYTVNGEKDTTTSVSLIIPATYNGKPVTAIGDYAFVECSLISVTIPDSVTSIRADAFGGCSSLTSVTISKGVTSIGNGALGSCEALKTINYAGTEAEWSAITKGTYAVPEDVQIICTDGTITNG